MKYTSKLSGVLYLHCIAINGSPYLMTWVKIDTISMIHLKIKFCCDFLFETLNA